MSDRDPAAAAAHPDPGARRRPGPAWYTVLILTVCYTLSFIDRQILSLLVGPIKADLGISDTQVGLLGGLAFSLFYTLIGLPVGRLVDRLNRRNIIVVGIVLWSAATAACAFTRTFPALFLMRMGVGVGEATLSPAAISMISDSVEKTRLSSALSVYAMGIYIGSGLALLFGGLIIEAVTATPLLHIPLFGSIASWRATFLIVGLPGLLVALWLLTLREPPRADLLAPAAGQSAGLTVRQTIAELAARGRSLGGIAGGITLQAVALYAFMLWSAATLQRSYGWSARDTGVTMGLVVLLGGCAGMATGGTLSDRLLRRGHRDAALRVATGACAASCITFVVLLATLGAAPATVACFLVGAFCMAMPTGSCYAASQLILPNQVRGQAMAVILVIGNLGGLTLGPLLPGLLNDRVFMSEGALGRSLAITLIGATFLATLVYAWARPAYHRDHARMHA